MGDKRIKDRFKIVNNYEEWLTCGALCIEFVDNGFYDIIIIDDYLPMYTNKQ